MYIRSFAKNIDTAIDTIKKRLGDMLICEVLGLLIATGIVVGLFVIFGIIAVSMIVSMISMNGLFSNFWSIFFWIIVLVIIIGTPILATTYIAQGGIMWIAHENEKGNIVAGPKAIGKSFSRIFAYLGFAFIQVISWIPMVLLLIGIFKLIGNIIGGEYYVIFLEQLIRSDSIDMLIFWFIVTILLILLIGFVVLLYENIYFYALPAIILEKAGPVEAIKESLSLIKGEFWHNFKKVLCYRLGVSGIGIGVSAIIGTFFAMALLLGKLWEPIYMILSVLLLYAEWGVRMAYTLFASTFSPIIIAKLYESQKCKIEGTDLRIKLHLLKQSQISEESANELE